MKFSSYGISDVGRLRSSNEDRILVDDANRVYAVADGLGGLPGGELASELAVVELGQAVQQLKDGQRLKMRQVFDQINAAVFTEGRRLHEDTGIGTTLTAVQFLHKKARVGHVGDSAAFLIRHGVLCALTEEHTLAAEMSAHFRQQSMQMPDYFFHTLTRCVGQKDTLKIFKYVSAVRPGDRFVICSDGLTKVLDNHQVVDMVIGHVTPREAVEGMLEAALDRGAPDNVSIIAIYVD